MLNVSLAEWKPFPWSMLNVSLTEWEDLLPPKVCWMYLLLSGKTSYPQKYAECISCWVETLPLKYAEWSLADPISCWVETLPLKYAECISFWVGRPPTPKSMLNVSLAEWEDLLPPKVCWMYLLLSGNSSLKVCWMYLLLSGKTSYPQKYAECISCWVECISCRVVRPPTPPEWEDLLPPKVCRMYLLLSGNPSPKVCWMYLLLSGNPSPKVCWMYLLLSGKTSYPQKYAECISCWVETLPLKYAECISYWVGRPPTPKSMLNVSLAEWKPFP